MEEKLKHLEFIQNVITRMNTNSFLIKSWMITIIAALFVLAAKDTNSTYAIIALVVVPIFWALDGFYLSQERMYRDLYNEVRIKDKIDFDMNANQYNKGRNTWARSTFSKTLLPLYPPIVLIAYLVLRWIN